MKFNVTKTDIKLGKRSDCNACPVTRSLRRYDPAAKGRVDYLLINNKKYDTPKLVVKFMDRFDFTGEADPFSFSIKLNE